MKKLRGLVVTLTLTAIAATAATLLQSQKPNKPGPQVSPLEQANEDFYTIVDFKKSSARDVREQARARRQNMKPTKGVDPTRFEIDEARDSSFGTPPTDTPKQQAFPTCDAVIIAFVNDGRAFLSEDRTSVTSEFSLRIEDVIKNNGNLSVGAAIDVLRGGGGVRFPSGKIIREGMWGKPLPKVGHRYVFFLNYNNDEGQDYSIVTAYELYYGKVLPLDGVSPTGNVQRQYSAYRKYEDAEEHGFLQEVRNAISQ